MTIVNWSIYRRSILSFNMDFEDFVSGLTSIFKSWKRKRPADEGEKSEEADTKRAKHKEYVSMSRWFRFICGSTCKIRCDVVFIPRFAEIYDGL